MILIHYVSFESNLLYMKKEKRRKKQYVMNNKTTNPFKSLEARTLNYSLLFFLLEVDPISRPPFTKHTFDFQLYAYKNNTHSHMIKEAKQTRTLNPNY